nr:DUF6371 domain-containing protein [Hoylesella enoeca]
MEEYKQYQLERYHGRGSRHQCPKCGDKHSFTYYIDEQGNLLDKTVGRCNHESGCGYHYTPKEYFQDNPEKRKERTAYRQPIRPKPIPPIDYVPNKYLLKSLSFDSYFCEFLCGIFDIDTINRAWVDYGIGATRDHGTIFWQIDIQSKIRTGKIIKYNSETGHRIKDLGINWVHSLMKRQGLLPSSFNLSQCLFGEHLLKMYPTKDVALVEAEKTAVICSMAIPKYNWLATGGKSQLSVDKMKVLRGRKVIAFPDVDGYEEWQNRSKDLSLMGIDIVVSDYLQQVATDEQRAKKIDIADLILEQQQSSTKLLLDRMIAENPAVGLLVEKFNLEIVE